LPPGIDGEQMDGAWAAAKKANRLVKFGGGFYCGLVDPPKAPAAPKEIFVINGFYAWPAGWGCWKVARVETCTGWSRTQICVTAFRLVVFARRRGFKGRDLCYLRQVTRKRKLLNLGSLPLNHSARV